MTPPSFDLFVNLRKELLEAIEKYAAMKKGLELLGEELSVTTQRINLFEKRLIPMYKGEIRYIKGRLEDNERATVMVAKIAQAEMLAEKSTFETA
jgi:V/A-type H+-transporting ATPase subunit D